MTLTFEKVAYNYTAVCLLKFHIITTEENPDVHQNHSLSHGIVTYIATYNAMKCLIYCRRSAR